MDELLDCFTPRQFDERYVGDVADRQEQNEELVDALLYRTAEIRAEIRNAVLILGAALTAGKVEDSDFTKPSELLPKDKGGKPKRGRAKRIDPQTEQMMARRHAP